MADHYCKDDPERFGPYRAFENLFRWPDPFGFWSQRSAGPDDGEQSPNGTPWSEAIQRAVEAGYELTEAQIKQGYDIAEQFNQRFTGLGQSGITDFQNVTNRLMSSSVDAAAGWVEFLSSIPLSVLSMVAGPGGTGLGGRSQSGSSGVSVAVKSSKSARPILHLNASAAGKKLDSHPLRSPSTRKTISSIGFKSDGPDGETILRIDVPDDMPDGVYSGAIHDEQGYSQGTLTVILG